MFTDEKEKLVKNLESYLFRNISEVTDFMIIISNTLKKYEESVKKQRNGIYENSINFIMSYVLDSKKLKISENARIVPSMIDAMFYCFPYGNPKGSSAIMIEGFKFFQKSCLELDILNHPSWIKWLKETKGEEYYQWMEKVLTCEIN